LPQHVILVEKGHPGYKRQKYEREPVGKNMFQFIQHNYDDPGLQKYE
jgi:hypothetical protein